MAAESICCGIGSGSCVVVGMADEHDGYKVVCGSLPCESTAISGLLCDSPYIDGADFVSTEEMGLLDCVAAGECS